MAVTVRTAALATLGTCVAMGLASLPPSRSKVAEAMRRPAWRAPARETHDSLRVARLELHRAEQVLVGLQLRDIWLERGDPADRPMVVFVDRWPPGIDALRPALDSALGLQSRTGGIGVVLRPESNAFPSQHVSDLPLLASYLVPTKPGEPCIAVFTVPMPLDQRRWPETLRQRFQLHDRDDLLGPCLRMTSLGAPGAGVGDWLAHGAALYGRFQSEPVQPAAEDLWLYDDWEGPTSGWGWSNRMSERRRPWLFTALPMERSFYYGTRAFGPGHTVLEGCRRGRRGACESLLRDPAGLGFRILTAEDFSVLVFRSWPRPRRAANPAYHLMSDLQREFGDARVAAFWRSAAPLDSAFTAAFGTTMDEWMHAWVLRNHGASWHDPALGAGNVAVSLAVTVALVGLAVGLGARRRVEF